MSSRQPALFLSHGAPTLALEDSPTHHFLRRLGQALPKPRAIVILSAHWQSPEPCVNLNPYPETVHDFGGFPAPLYQLQYPAETDQLLARQVLDSLQAAGFNPSSNSQRGLDHGMWVPLMLMHPAADIPLVPISLPRSASVAQLIALGRALRPLRDDNVLLIGSGSYTHNLGQLYPEGSTPQPWSLAFAAWLDDALERQDAAALENWQTLAPHAQRNHPSDEHIRPLWVMQGAAGPDGRASKLHDDWRAGNLSMACWRFD